MWRGAVSASMKTWLQVSVASLIALSSWIVYIVYAVINTDGNPSTTTDEIIRIAGYPCEIHKIQTEDGFILTAFRIPYGKDKKPGQRPAFWLQHGLTGSSDQYVHLGPQNALPFLLADKGYDVWIGNARGNYYSHENVNYTLIDSQFWDFSFDEMGYYDLPAVITHVLNVTKETKIIYAGHSMGTAMLMVLLTERPQFQEKIEIAFGLAPAVFMSHSHSFTFSLFTKYIGPFLLKVLGPGPILPKCFPKIQNFLWPGCSPECLTSLICNRIYQLSFGPSSDVNPDLYTAFVSSSPSQTSFRAMAHYGQSIETGEFRAFDFGENMNIKYYGSRNPPTYDLKSIKTPVVLMFSDNDYIVTPKDEYDLCLNLGNVVQYYRVPHPSFDHMDFLYGRSARNLVYEKIFEILDNKSSIFSQKAVCHNDFDPSKL